MNNPNDVVRGKHLDSLASAIFNDLPSDFSGATSVAGGASGLVPAPSAGDENKFLRGDGQWATVSGGGSGDVVIIGTTPSTVNGAIWLEV